MPARDIAAKRWERPLLADEREFGFERRDHGDDPSQRSDHGFSDMRFPPTVAHARQAFSWSRDRTSADG